MPQPVMIITGASSGIGAATARRMAGDGFRLTLAARREDRLHRLAEEVQGLGGEALIVPTDVTRRSDLENMLQSTLERWGGVDILFNNAGVALDNALERMDPDQIIAEINTNLTAMILATQLVLPVMLRQRSGHIINNASLNALVATPHNPIYCATKFGVVGFSESLRRRLRRKNIKVSTFCTGNTPSEIAPAYKMHAEGNPDAPKLKGMMPTTYVADQVADLIYHPRRMLIIPRSWRPLLVLSPLVPGLTDKLVKYFT